ncbi:MAG: TonB-dependent receptor [Proteobacteria bacterium]|nr:TonB-dependent receptor [Pseudomonadota bacterium]MDA1057434.1 TonB-dependent receptor [Pseudomonadota bacterium]
MKKKYLLTSAALAVLGTLAVLDQAHAQTLLPDTVVTATRIPVPADQVGGAVTVIDAKELARKQRRSLSDALLDVPGTRVVQLGGPGHQSSLFVRGANSNHVLVLLDGIEISDPSQPAGAYNFGNFFLGDVGRIEVLRGAQASTYGSEAIAGVVNIVSAPAVENGRALQAEGGSFGTFNQAGRVTRVGEKWAVAASLAHAKDGGESLTARRFVPANGNEEEDSYENVTGSLRVDLAAADNLDLRFVAHAFQTRVELDPTAEDPNASSETRQYYARLQGTSSFYQGQWLPTVGLNVTHVKRGFFNYPDSLANTVQATQDTGKRLKADWRNDLLFFQDHQIGVGIEYEHEKLDDTQFANFSGFVISGASKETAATRTAYVQDTFNWSDKAFVIADIRHDDNTRFAGKTTYRISPVFLLPSFGTRLRGAYGTGFRAPALFELFGSTSTSTSASFRGNRNLRPEESTTWEVGVDQTFLADRAVVGVTYFDSRIKNLIVAAGTPTTPNNVQEADINGVEATLKVAATPTVDVTAAYTFTASEIAATGQSLLRRPKHKVDIDVRWQPSPAMNLSALFGYIGTTRDAGFNGGTVYRGGYAVTGLRGDWQLRDDVTAFARIDNLFDNYYEVADGFRGQGRSALVGARLAF